MGNGISRLVNLFGQRFASGLVGKYFPYSIRILLTLPLLGLNNTPMINKNTYYPPFGELLKSARTSKGYSRKEVSEILGISANAIAKYEGFGVTKDGQSPALPRLAAMAVLYDIDARVLFASLVDTPREARKLLLGAQLSNKKTEDFIIDQLGYLSDAITAEIHEFSAEIFHWESDLQALEYYNESYTDIQKCKRQIRSMEKRIELLKQEVSIIEEVNIFAIKPEEKLYTRHGSVTNNKEPEDTSLATSSSGSTPPQSETKGVDHDD